MKNISQIKQLLTDHNINELARRINAAGYPIDQSTIHYWKTGRSGPRADRLRLAERVVREKDPEIADIIAEILSSLQ